MTEKNRDKDQWVPEELGDQSSYEGTTEIKRRLRRGDETKGNPDERDIAGAIDVGETPEARENQSTLHSTPRKIPPREPAETTPGTLKKNDEDQ